MYTAGMMRVMKKRRPKTLAHRSLALHKKTRGKIETKAKMSLKKRETLALAYTPGVGAVSTYLAEHPEQARDYTFKGNSVAIVSDGSAVLGLGNIGPYGAYPVMEGKALIFKEFAGIDGVPIVLSTQDPDEIVKTVLAIAPTFGGINLEDIKAPGCFSIEERLVEALDIPVMHDDQHGTAIVVLAGLLNAAKVVKKRLQSLTVVISGAGAAGTATAALLHAYGVKDILMLDRGGIISKDRADLNAEKRKLLAYTNPKHISGDLKCALAGADAVIGLSGPGLMTREHVRLMNPKAIVFALSNPVPEIMPEEAKAGGAAVVGTGRSDFPNQINNALVFPGIFRGALDKKLAKITTETKLRAAKALASLVAKPSAGKIVPDIMDKRVVKAVARSVR
jgi:malate dehydrogenase (oxaloacetate-decarboxylating)